MNQAMNQTMYGTYNLRRLLQIFFRQKFKLLLIFMVAIAGGVMYVERMVPVYESGGSLLVKFGHGARPDINMADLPPSELSYSDRREIMQSNVKILHSRVLLKDVLRELDHARLYPDVAADVGMETAQEIAIDRLLRGDLKVRADEQSNVISVTVRSYDPEIAAGIAQGLIDKFSVLQAALYQTPQAGAFLAEQAAAQQERLANARQELLAFKNQVGVSDIDQEIGLLMSEKSSLNAIAFGAVNEAQARLAALEAQAAEMKTTYNPQSPMLTRLMQSIEVAQAQLLERRSDLKASRDSDRPLSERIAAINDRIAFLEAQRGRYNELAQNVDAEQESYRFYQLRAESERVNNLLHSQNITRIAVVDRPGMPGQPMPQHKGLIMLAFIMGGLLAGLGAALWSELSDDRAVSPDQISTQIAMPVLVDFAKMKGV